jgi:hypothetical protein
MLTANALLNRIKPEDLFSGDPAKAKQQFRKLAKQWHPDHNTNPRASEVFAHLRKLHEEGLKKIEDGLWEGSGLLSLQYKGWATLKSKKYLRMIPFELGQCYIGKKDITYVLDQGHKEFFDTAIEMMKSCTYADERMYKEVNRYLPVSRSWSETVDKKLVLEINKDPGAILLRDVLNYYNGSIEPRHVGWIQNTIHNLTCYLQYAGITHANISPDTYFISPEMHSGALLGGWWYAAKRGDTINKLPRRTLDYLPWSVRTDKKATHLIDIELVKATGRELLGDITGTKLNKAPEPLIRYLTDAASGTAIENYSAWKKALLDSFGPNKFVNMEIDVTKIYPKN